MLGNVLVTFLGGIWDMYPTEPSVNHLIKIVELLRDCLSSTFKWINVRGDAGMWELIMC